MPLCLVPLCLCFYLHFIITLYCMHVLCVYYCVYQVHKEGSMEHTDDAPPDPPDRGERRKSDTHLIPHFIGKMCARKNCPREAHPMGDEMLCEGYCCFRCIEKERALEEGKPQPSGVKHYLSLIHI